MEWWKAHEIDPDDETYVHVWIKGDCHQKVWRLYFKNGNYYHAHGMSLFGGVVLAWMYIEKPSWLEE